MSTLSHGTQTISGASGKLVPCIGCGAHVADIEGPAHPYIGASPGCWAMHGEVLAKEYGEYRYPSVHRLTVDTYAVQHPGTPSPQSIQSVAVHLISLCVAIENGHASRTAIEAMGKAARHSERFTWLEPPSMAGTMTIRDVAKARNLAEHEALVTRWARSVWEAWSPHHQTIRQWTASRVMAERRG